MSEEFKGKTVLVTGARDRRESPLLKTFLKKTVGFASHQITQVRQGGIRVVFIKVKKLGLRIKQIPYFLLALPIIIIIRVLRPLVTIRFGLLVSSRIGYLAGYTEIYLCERDLRLYGAKTHDVFYVLPPVCNEQLMKMLKRTLNISSFAYYLSLANCCFPGSARHTVKMPHRDIDVKNLLGRTQTHLSFTSEEEQFGQQELRKMGLPEKASFVGFIGRDSAYLDNYQPDIDWKYHDYRNMDIRNFVQAMEELTKREYFILRMGHIVQQPLDVYNHKVIDYASHFRTDFLDIFLCSKCHFFVNGMAGLDAVPMLHFRRPMVKVNFIPLNTLRSGAAETIYIPKKYWLVNEHRFITFKEIFESDVGRFGSTEQYYNAGIELIDNTTEEIAAVVLEMDERLKGTWYSSEEDIELQRRFWELFKPDGMHKFKYERQDWFRALIGAEFLRQNQKLLK